VYTKFLGGPFGGGFGAGAATAKAYSALGVPHSEVKIRMRFMVIDSWDGEHGWVSIDGTLLWDVPFAFPGAFPDQCGVGGFRDHGPNDVLIGAPHSTPTILVEATATRAHRPWDASWGIDDVAVLVR
jgi:hypothetical protein